MNGRAKGLRIVLTGAKTGGHLYPALTTAKRLIDLSALVTMVTSGEPVEAMVLGNTGIPLETLRVSMLKGMGLTKRIRGIMTIPNALVSAKRLLRRLRPDLVVGFGGYTTGPLVLVAALSNIPCAICEQNSVPGFTNRVLARFVKRVFITFEESAAYFKTRNITVTGSPVRQEILAVPPKHYDGPARRFLVLGGSQGSAFLNAKIPLVLGKVAQEVNGVEVLHQSGPGRDGDVRQAYETASIKADVRGYIEDMAWAWEWADLLIARAGAGTVTEASAIGIPSIYVPFAAAADNHQVANARPLVTAGAALMFEEGDFDTETVAAHIVRVARDPSVLNAMACAARSWGKRDALDNIVNGLLELVGR